MKTKKPMRPLLAAFVLLVGITSTDAALCTATSFGATVTTCDCPLGMAPTGSYQSALPTGSYGVPAGNTVAQKRTAANTALALCKDLLPGYRQPGVLKALPVACVLADGYCTGKIGAFATSAATSALGTEGSYTAELSANLIATGAGATLFKSSLQKIACPTGTSNAGQSAPFTIYKCIVTNGKYISAAAGEAAAVTSACTAGNVCPSGATAGDAQFTPLSCIGGGNTVGVVGGFICPASTYGVLGANLAATIAAISGKTMCGAGSGPKAGAQTCDALPGYYGATSATGVAMTACPVGIDGLANKATLKLGCTGVAPGYSVLSDIAAQTTPGALTALLAGITTCPINKMCPGKATKFTITGTSASSATYLAVTKLTGDDASTVCPTGIGNAKTGASAQGANAVSFATACVDLLDGYAFIASAGASDTATVLISVCAKDQYGCGGSTGLFKDYTATTATVSATFGVEANKNMIVKTKTVLQNAVTNAASGTLVKTNCPASSKASAAGDTIAACLTIAGKYVDHSSLSTSTDCPKSKYCPGGHTLGSAGGDLSCPLGSTGPATPAAGKNSHIGDCTVNDGFYIVAGAVNVPVPCLTANICAGGGPVGTAGGSVACPTDSTNTACVAGAGSTTTTVNLTPASQPITVAAPNVAAPDVTVTNTVPSASSASTTVASMALIAVSAFVVAL